MNTYALTPEQREQFERDGYVIVRGLLGPEEVAEIRETFMAQAKDGPVEGLSEFRHSGEEAYSASDPLRYYPRMMHPHRHGDKPVGPLSMKYMLHPRLRPVLSALFGEEPFAVQSMFYFKPPGARGQDLHQDNFYLRVKPGTCMAAWFAIDDADQENGGMVLARNTQDMEVVCPEKSDPTKFFTSEHVEPPPGSEIVPADMKAGDVLFFNGSVIHGSYPNTSRSRFRRSFICHYVPASTKELSNWYTAPLSFDGATHAIAPAQGGGPCGNLQESAAPH